LKLADFGLTKELEGLENFYKILIQQPIPVRWAAVELMSKSTYF
jgi:hypothetical protein